MCAATQKFPQCPVNLCVMESEPGVTQNQRSLMKLDEKKQERFMVITSDYQRKRVPSF